FGSYANPLGAAKLAAGDIVSLVGALKVEEGPATGAPGQVVALDDRAVTISAADHDVRLSDFRCLAGEPRHPNALGLRPGGRVPPLAPLMRETLEAVAGAELYWQEALTKAEPPQSPYPSNRDLAMGAM